MAFEGDLRNILSPLFAGEVYPVINNSKDIKYPYTTYYNVSGSALTIHSNDIKRRRIQIDIFAKSYGEAKRLGEQVDNAMDSSSIASAYINNSDAWEETPSVYRLMLEFYMWA